MNLSAPPARQGLYDPRNEHDACGLGFIAHIKDKKSHEIVTQGLRILTNLTHRGATGADPLQGDGAGILIQIPHAFLKRECARIGIELPDVGEYGVGMIFLPRDPGARAACEHEIARAIAAEGQDLLGWRDVPVDNRGLGEGVKASEPFIRMVFVGRGLSTPDVDAFERKLYVIRKSSGHAIRALNLRRAGELYVPSFSARTLIYKGMLLAHQVGEFYLDLQDPALESAIAMVHQRFSTNTFPTWNLAHPFRLIAHNGEINTLRGNVNWLRARQQNIASKLLGEGLYKIWPLIYDGQSDSASFDNALELLYFGGYSLAHAMMLMIPEAWADNPLMDDKRRAFYEYHAALMEPWDGPAAMAFTDGRQIGATLDRNGLRPARYVITDDDLVILASEAGVLDIPERKIVKKWRLQPGKMLLIDLGAGAHRRRSRAQGHARQAPPLPEVAGPHPAPAQGHPHAGLRAGAGRGQGARSAASVRLHAGGSQADHGADGGDRRRGHRLDGRRHPARGALRPAAPALRLLPPALRAGHQPAHRPDPRGDGDVAGVLHRPAAQHPRPRRERAQHAAHRQPADPHLRGHGEGGPRRGADPRALPLRGALHVLPGGVGRRGHGGGARQALRRRRERGAEGRGQHHHPLRPHRRRGRRSPSPRCSPPATCTSTWCAAGLRTRTGLVVETGSAREVHHFALLAGYGAEAIHPNLAFATLAKLGDLLPHGTPHNEACARFVKAVSKGLLKVMSKMGISTYQSYCGAQIFEAVGLASAFVDKYFTGTSSVVEGVGLEEIAEETVRLHRTAYGDAPLYRAALDAGGDYAYRMRGEAHMWTPDAISKLQHSTRSGSYATYREYAKLINEQSERLMTLRGLFDIKEGKAPVPLDEVEPAASRSSSASPRAPCRSDRSRTRRTRRSPSP